MVKDSFTGLHWLAEMLHTGSTSNIKEPSGTTTPKSGSPSDDVAGCLAAIARQCQPEKQAIIGFLVEHYIHAASHAAVINDYGTLLLRSRKCKIDVKKAAAIALAKTMSVQAYNASASDVVRVYDICLPKKQKHISKQAYNKSWKPHIEWLMGKYLSYLGQADMYAREYKREFYSSG